MEQIVPGRDPDDFDSDSDSDPICEANDLKDAGDGADAYQILMELCQAGLRCPNANAHLGSVVFDRLLWFNPSDIQGVRFLIDAARAKAPWEDREKR